MSDAELDQLAIGVQTLPGRPLGQAGEAPLRVSQILSTDGLRNEIPYVWIGDPADPITVRIVGNTWDYHPGDTILYQHRGSMPIIVGKLSNVGTETDPEEDDYPKWTPINPVGGASPAFFNSWGNFGGVHAVAAFYQQSDGWCRLKGLVSGGTTTGNTVIMNGLPAPAHTLYFNCATSGPATAVVEIDNAGQLRVELDVSSTFLSLAGITYPAPNHREFAWDSDWAFYRGHWEVPLLETGWSKAGVSESEIEIFVRSDGWCWVKGVLDAGTTPGPIGHFPGRAAPGWLGYQIPVKAGTVIGRHDLGGGVDVSNRGPTRWRSETPVGVGLDHYVGGMNYWGRGSEGVVHAPAAALTPTLLNSWTNFGTDYMGARYLKDSHGIVHLIGYLQGNASTADTMFTLPAGFRPAEQHVFNAMFAANTQGRVDVETDGDVVATAHPNTQTCTITGITFRAEQ